MTRHDIRKMMYRLEVRFGLTATEFRGFLLFAALLVVGIIIREYSLRIPAIDPELKRELEEEFARRTAQLYGRELVGPVQEELPDLESAPLTVASSGELLDLNRATRSQLEELPRIGPALSLRIVQHRERYGPFRSVSDLLMIDGIGPATLAGLQLLVMAAPVADPRAVIPPEGLSGEPPPEAPPR